MSVEKPVGKGPEDPFEKYQKYRVEEVGKDKHEKEEKKHEEEPTPHFGYILLLLLRKIVEYFIHLGGAGISERLASAMRNNLLLLKQSFETLGKEDRSQDVPFINQLSKVWHQTLEASLKFKRSDPFSLSFRNFIKKIQNFPEKEEHTFGYYLTEYTGGKWLPFPYMDLIASLHAQYQNDPTSSPLALWIQEIEGLIGKIHPE